jgi:RNA polymerase sigma-70 factor (ECF subfamily)
MDTLRAVIDTLHTDYATFLHLSVFEGLSLEEIAKIMKKTKKQITNLAYRARQALKDILGKEESANEKP